MLGNALGRIAASEALASSLFLFFACLAPAVAFGGLMSVATGGAIGTTEMLFATALCGATYALTAGQPLVIVGSTGPALAFTALIHQAAPEAISYPTPASAGCDVGPEGPLPQAARERIVFFDAYLRGMAEAIQEGHAQLVVRQKLVEARLEGHAQDEVVLRLELVERLGASRRLAACMRHYDEMTRRHGTRPPLEALRARPRSLAPTKLDSLLVRGATPSAAGELAEMLNDKRDVLRQQTQNRSRSEKSQASTDLSRSTSRRNNRIPTIGLFRLLHRTRPHPRPHPGTRHLSPAAQTASLQAPKPQDPTESGALCMGEPGAGRSRGGASEGPLRSR